MPYVRQAPDASRVAERAGKPKLDLAKHFMTSKQKTHPNQRFQFCADSMDTKSFDQFSRFLNSDTAVAMSKPAVGISTHASTLSHCEEELRPFLTKGIYGKAIDTFIKNMEKIQQSLKTIDSFSDRPGRDFDTMLRDVENTAEHMKKLYGNAKWKEFVVSMRAAGVRLMHYSQALQELMVVLGGDPLEACKAIPAAQPCPDLLLKAAKSSTSATCQPRYMRWLAQALVDKNKDITHGPAPQTGSTTNFESLALESGSEQEQEDPVPQSPVSLGSPQSAPATPPAQPPAPKRRSQPVAPAPKRRSQAASSSAPAAPDVRRSQAASSSAPAAPDVHLVMFICFTFGSHVTPRFCLLT